MTNAINQLKRIPVKLLNYMWNPSSIRDNTRHKRTGKMQWTREGAHDVLQIGAKMASNNMELAMVRVWSKPVGRRGIALEHIDTSMENLD